MKRSKFIFYIIFLAFHLFLFIFTLVVENNQNDFDFLFGLQSKIPMFKYVALFGLVLFLTDFILANVSILRHKKEVHRLMEEQNALKAKMYDMQEGSKEKAAPEPTPAPGNEDDTSKDEPPYTD